MVSLRPKEKKNYQSHAHTNLIYFSKSLLKTKLSFSQVISNSFLNIITNIHWG